MKTIALTQGRSTIVDDEDFEALSGLPWYFNDGYAKRRVRRGGKVVVEYMHKAIMGARDAQCDHINGDTLDNRRENIRICTPEQNNLNRKKYRNNTTGYKGVSACKNGKFVARICTRGQTVFLGHFKTAREAGEAYMEAAQKYHGAFARKE